MPQGQSDGSVVVDILLDGEKAKKYWENFTSYMNMSTKQLERELVASTKKINELQSAYGEVSEMIKQLRHEKLSINWDDTKSAVLEKAQKNIEDYTRKISALNIQKGTLLNLGASSSGLSAKDWSAQIDSLRQQIDNLKQQKKLLEDVEFKLRWQKRSYDDITESIEYLKSVRKELYNQSKQEAQNFQNMNAKYVQLTKEAKEQENTTKNIEKHTKNIKHNTTNIGANLKSGVSRLASGLKSILRMSLALIGIRSIYTGITNALRTWMNSEDELAKKTKANLENLKLNFVQMLQPAIQWIINAFNNVLALVGAVVKQFTNLNIFAKKTAQSTKDMSKSASNTLASFDKIDVLQKDSGGTSQEQNIDPIDMTGLMDKYEGLAQQIKAIMETIFDPFKKAWDEKGEDVIASIKTSFESIKGLGEGIGESIAEVWTNGTVEQGVKTILSIFEDIIKIIGNVAGAWENAWKDDNTGTKIIQNLADSFNNILDVIKSISGFIEQISQSEGYQKFIDANTKAIETISSIIKFITETWENMISEKSPEWGENIGEIFENFAKVIEKIVEAINKIKDDEEFQKWYKKAVDKIGDAVTVLTDWWKVLSDILVLIVDPNWENLKTLGEDMGKLGEDANKIDEISKAFKTLWKVLNVTKYIGNVPLLVGKIIKEIVSHIDWEEVKKKTEEAWDGIKTFVTDTFDNIKDEAPKKIDELKGIVAKEFEKISKALVGDDGIITKINKGIRTKFEDLKTAIPKKIEDLKGFVSTKFTNIKNALVGDTGIVTKLNKGIREKFEDLKTAIPKKVEELKTYLDTKFNNIKNALVGENSIVQKINKGVRTWFEDLKTAIPQKIEDLKSTLSTKFTNIKNALVGENSIVQKINKGVRTWFEDLKTAIPQKIEDMKSKMWGKFENIRDTIGSKISEITSKISSPFENIGTGISNALGNAYEWYIKPKLNAIITGVETMINRIIDKINDFSNNKITPVITTGALGAVLKWMGVSTSSNQNWLQHVYIPRLALGGIATQATPAIIGEAGKEAILPLENNTEWMDTLADKIAGNQNFVIKFTGSLSQLAKVLKPEIDKENKRVGRSYIVGGNT